MDTKKLRQKILDLAIRGKLVPQDPNDEPASVLLERIKEEKERLIKEGKIKKSKKTVSSDTYHYEQILPKGWCWTVLGDIFQHNNGKQKTSSNQEGELYKYITTSNVYWNKFDFSEVKQMRFLESEFEKYIAKKGDLLVCEGGDIGRAAIWNYDYNICIQNHLHRLRAYIPVCTKYFLFSLMDSKAKGVIKGKGIGLMSLSANDLHNIIIALPPLSEQYRIVTEIERWFTLISQIEQDKSALQSVIKQAKSKILRLAIYGKLVPQDPNDEPASELLKRINPNAEITCDNGHSGKLPYEIPKTWVWCSHNSILDISGGSQPAKSYFETILKPNYIRLYQIRDYGESPVPVYIPINFASKQTEKGDILLARYGGSLGKVFHAEQGAYNVAMAKVIFKFENLIYKEFAYYYYLSDLYQGKLKEISRTAQTGFNSADFNDMYFPLPPINEQQCIVQKMEELFSSLDDIQKNLEV